LNSNFEVKKAADNSEAKCVIDHPIMLLGASFAAEQVKPQLGEKRQA